jgi:predicted lipid-binding transport protein (Tim44 family)
MVAVDTADAQRRGGGFGSRGARTYRAPPPTRTAPQPAAPVQRSMTQPTPTQQPGARPAAPAAAATPQTQRRGGFLGGLGGGILGGLLVGGLIGALMGNGFGAGMAGFGAMLLQLGIIALVVMLAVKLFRRRQQPAFGAAAAAGGGWPNTASLRDAPAPQGGFAGFGAGGFGSERSAVPPTPVDQGTDFQVTNQDRQAFERLLIEIQDGLNREDYAALRERTTPEVMGFIAETLASNATAGHRHDVTGTRLLEADVAEAWREGDRDYATAAMRFEGLDVLRDRATGAPIEGDPDRPVQTVELWTFMRQGGPWKLSAIQEVNA